MAHTVKLHNVQKDYIRLAGSYESRWADFLNITNRWILDRIENSENVIDLGCGTGLLLKHIRDRHPRASLHGIDASADMLALAQKRLPQATLQQGNLDEMDIRGRYDLALSVNILHHLNDPQGHIGSLKQLCTGNGTVFLSDFAIHTLPLKFMELYWRLFHPAHHKAFAVKTLRHTLTDYFTIEDEAVLAPDHFWRLQIYQLALK